MASFWLLSTASFMLVLAAITTAARDFPKTTSAESTATVAYPGSTAVNGYKDEKNIIAFGGVGGVAGVGGVMVLPMDPMGMGTNPMTVPPLGGGTPTNCFPGIGGTPSNCLPGIGGPGAGGGMPGGGVPLVLGGGVGGMGGIGGIKPLPIP